MSFYPSPLVHIMHVRPDTQAVRGELSLLWNRNIHESFIAHFDQQDFDVPAAAVTQTTFSSESSVGTLLCTALNTQERSSNTEEKCKRKLQG